MFTRERASSFSLKLLTAFSVESQESLNFTKVFTKEVLTKEVFTLATTMSVYDGKLLSEKMVNCFALRLANCGGDSEMWTVEPAGV